MSVNSIYDSVQKRVKKSKSRNPFIIAEDSGIMLVFDKNLNKMKGMYTIIKRNRIRECEKKSVKLIPSMIE